MLIFFSAAILVPALRAEEVPVLPAVPERVSAPEPGMGRVLYRSGTARQILDWSKRSAGSEAPLDSTGWDTKRADLLLYLARFHTYAGDIEAALNYHMRLLREVPVGPWTMEFISEYRHSLMLYNQKNGAALEEAIPEDGKRLRKIEREFARSTDLAAYHERLAEYYFSTLNFEDAKEHIALAFSVKPVRKSFFKKTPPSQASLRRLLRNLHMLEGNFTAARQESRTLLVSGEREANENDIALDSFLKEVSGRVLSPLDIRYKSGPSGFLPVMPRKFQILKIRPVKPTA